MTRTRARAGILCVCVALSQACGGGGSGDDGANAVPRGPNHVPTQTAVIPDQQLIFRHPFEFDVSQSGTSFTDPDGDLLTYRVEIDIHQSGLTGLTASGPVISGAPSKSGLFLVGVTVIDGRGGEAGVVFELNVAPNSQPRVVNPNSDRVLSAEDFVDLEVTADNTVFSDADGDVLTYDVSFAAQSHGLSIVGTRVAGRMNSIGLARIRVIAEDGFGGFAEDAFSLARPASEPGPPSLPSPSYIYDDAELNLPCQFQQSREHGIPFPDTTPADNPTTNAGATLGRVLFYDSRLSITNTVSCSTCHRQQLGFAAAERFSIGALGTPQTRNAMSLGNVRYSEFNSFFWDNRVFTLEELVPIPIENPTELAQPMGLLLPKLAATGFYPPLFEAAFGSTDITRDRISKAISQFLRAMIAYRSKFDESQLVQCMGDVADPSLVLNAQELRGLQLAGDSGCFLCHDEQVLIVNAPRNNGLDARFTDPGQGHGRFRPPSLRNVRVSGPYMHDGRFATLRDVINHYDHGVQDSADLDDDLRDEPDGPPRRLNLTEEDKDALEAFLDTLSDYEFLTDPRFSDPFQ